MVNLNMAAETIWRPDKLVQILNLLLMQNLTN
jgi:hypothetical protein